MSDRWQARFEIVSGPHDGLTFVVANEGLSIESEILAVPDAQELYLRDFVEVGFEVGSEGVRVNTGGAFTLNGEQASGGQIVTDGDVLRIGATEVMLVAHAGAPASGEQGGAEGEDGSAGGFESRTDSGLAAAPRRCLRPGCGAMNPSTATWCLKCGWDLEIPDEDVPT
ncbi:MAG TPA: hypothetical protein VJ787_14580 [Thermoleophilia bacterium]|nr:hypothetical protein [Thermoleophilia bacterium]